MLTQLAGGIANVIADAVMIQNFPSVESAAWASMISQTLAAGMCLVYYSPGDPAVIALSKSGMKASEEVVEAERKEMGLDQPIGVQYARWLGNLMKGDLGESYKSGKPVAVELKKAVFPTLVLSLALASWYIRQVRGIVLKEMEREYVEGLRSRGIAERRILFVHVLKNCLFPLITLLGISFGLMLGGSTLVESIFSWPGLGRLAVASLHQRKRLSGDTGEMDFIAGATTGFFGAESLDVANGWDGWIMSIFMAFIRTTWRLEGLRDWKTV